MSPEEIGDPCLAHAIIGTIKRTIIAEYPKATPLGP
jgi:hypothetical protein